MRCYHPEQQNQPLSASWVQTVFVKLRDLVWLLPRALVDDGERLGQQASGALPVFVVMAE